MSRGVYYFWPLERGRASKSQLVSATNYALGEAAKQAGVHVNERRYEGNHACR
jgi:hypothetical protein